MLQGRNAIRKIQELDPFFGDNLFFEVKTSIAALHDFWQGKIVWVGVSNMLVLFSYNFLDLLIENV
jgi:hypothetical protein